MEEQNYPNLQVICRLCLKENAGTVRIFPQKDDTDKFAALSIPMRIMTCAALEVQATDGLPSKVCTECRLQLEKSYYFRKQSQASDAKLRKHIRLVGMGKKSKVFIKTIDEDDDDDDELEFKDTLDFIKEQEEKHKKLQQLQLDDLMNEMKLQNEQELKKSKESLELKCRLELTPKIKDELRHELKKEIEKELETTMRQQLKEECIKEAKDSLRNELREECRQLEMKCLLNDLQTFLKEKKKSISAIEPNRASAETPKTKSLSPTIINFPTTKKICNSYNSSIEKNKKNVQNRTMVKDELILSDNFEEIDESDGEGNFLVYNIDDGYELEKAPLSNSKDQYSETIINEAEEEDEYIDSNSNAFATCNEQIEATEESEPTSTTSYHIEDSGDGGIKFLKKSKDDPLTVDNVEQTTDDNIMILNFPEAMEEDQLVIGEYVNDYDKAVKSITMKKQTSIKSNKSPNNKNTINTSPSTFANSTTTTTTLETTYLTKTYINPLQRITDTPKIFKCDDCPMVFSTKSSMDRHVRTHRKIEETGVTHQCPECQIVVSCTSALRRHMFVHYEEKPFACNECGKAFVQKEILKRHMQTHTGIKPHNCPHCDRAFAQRINLTQHINRNHLENPRIQQYSCHLCPKRFNHASGLSRHLATHSGVAFQCSECDRTFGDRSSIKRHIANMHRVKPNDTK